MWGFKKYREAVVETYSKDVEKEEIEEETAEEEKLMPVEEWVWVEGYKGTDKDMKCRDFQYELGKQYDMSYDEAIIVCGRGYHLCRELRDVFRYYEFENDNRFFEVKALVRKSDYDNYYMSSIYYGRKLVAKSIIFTRELSLDELCKCYGIEAWAEEHKKIARTFGIPQAEHIIRTEELTKLGYSETFAQLLATNEYFDIARRVSSQEGLSVDMKVWTIFTLASRQPKNNYIHKNVTYSCK